MLTPRDPTGICCRAHVPPPLRSTPPQAAILARRTASIETARAATRAADEMRRAARAKLKKDDLKRQMDMEEARRKEIERRKADELARERERVMGLSEQQQATQQQWPAKATTEPRKPRADRHSLVDIASDDSDGEEDADLGDAARALKSLEAPKPTQARAQGQQQQQQQQQQKQQGTSLPRQLGGLQLGEPGSIDYGSESDGEDGRPAVTAAVETLVDLELDPNPEPECAPPPTRNVIRTTVRFAEKQAGPAGGFLPARDRPVELPDGSAGGAGGLGAAEREPVFLKDKADEFFRAGNLQGAIAAYEQAIDNFSSRDELQLKGALLANLAAANLKAGDSFQAVEAASRGIAELAEAAEAEAEALAAHGVDAATEAGAAARATLSRLYARRGAGRANLADGDAESLAEAADDYRKALAHAPEGAREQLSAALEEVEAAAGPPPGPAELKARGDIRMRRGDHSGAVDAYTHAAARALAAGKAGDVDEDSLALVAACLANRAIARLKSSRFAESAADCCKALRALASCTANAALVATEVTIDNETLGVLGEDAAALAATGRGQQAARLACRAAAALAHLKRYADARAAYAAAARAAPAGSEQREQIERDAAMLDNLSRDDGEDQDGARAG